MHAVDSMIKDILRREGGFVDDPNDRGGTTNHGISLRYAKGVGLDLDGDGDVDGDDIRLVTPDMAFDLYRDDFFVSPRINRLPEEIQPQVFDIAVNSGPPRAIMIVQKVINMAGFGPTDVDGVIGPDTVRRAKLAQEDGGNLFNNAIMHERVRFYHALVKSDPTQERFLVGWLNRAKEFEL